MVKNVEVTNSSQPKNRAEQSMELKMEHSTDESSAKNMDQVQMFSEAEEDIRDFISSS